MMKKIGRAFKRDGRDENAYKILAGNSENYLGHVDVGRKKKIKLDSEAVVFNFEEIR